MYKNSGEGVWWYMPVIPALGRLRQEDIKFEASLCFVTDPITTRKKKKVEGAVGWGGKCV
jgi:hypothetical protein